MTSRLETEATSLGFDGAHWEIIEGALANLRAPK